jgi:FAD binding domain
MTGISLPDPVIRRSARPAADAVDAVALERDLRERVDGEVRFDAGSRAAYSTDASNYRQVPIGVVVPRTIEGAAAAVRVCHEHGAPVVSRGGGTSLAGQTCNVAVVIDWSKYCHRVTSIDPDAKTCIVEPGIVLDALNKALAPHQLMFGPRPATHDHCTLGGMLGNNSCGATAQAYGKTSTSTCSTPAAAGWPATSASRPGTTTCRWLAPSGRCSRPSATRRLTRWCWPTASAAAPRSSRPAPAGPPPTWPRS